VHSPNAVARKKKKKEDPGGKEKYTAKTKSRYKSGIRGGREEKTIGGKRFREVSLTEKKNGRRGRKERNGSREEPCSNNKTQKERKRGLEGTKKKPSVRG